MKKLIVLTSAAFLWGCGDGSQEISKERKALDAEMALFEASDIRGQEAQKGIADILYPSCDVLVEDKKPTSCGIDVLAKSIDECASRALVWSGGTAILGEFAGDSWINAAGRHTVQSPESRAHSLAAQGGMSGVEFVAILRGQGTRTIDLYSCGLSNEWHLSSLGEQGSRFARQ